MINGGLSSSASACASDVRGNYNKVQPTGRTSELSRILLSRSAELLSRLEGLHARVVPPRPTTAEEANHFPQEVIPTLELADSTLDRIASIVSDLESAL